MFVDAASLFNVLAELLSQLLNGRQSLHREAGGRNLLKKSSDGCGTFGEEEDLLVGGTVLQHG